MCVCLISAQQLEITAANHLTLLPVPFELGAGMPHGVEHCDRPERRLVVVVELLGISVGSNLIGHVADLFERSVHLTAHTTLLAVGRKSSFGPHEWLTDPQTTLRAVWADVSIMLVREKVGFEQGVVNEGLEDSREETSLREIEEGSEAYPLSAESRIREQC